MKNQYQKFDEMLLEHINLGKNTTAKLTPYGCALMIAAKQYCVKDRFGCWTPEFRIIDRRLQALRKAGKITFIRGVWVPT